MSHLISFALRFAAICYFSVLMLSLPKSAWADEPVHIGSQRELFVDHFLIDRIEDGATLKLHRPKPQEVVLTTDQPWEGNTSAYFTIFQDGALYRMYYRGSHWDEQTKKASHSEVTCYAESRDGIHWIKPELGIFEFAGSKQNNIVWDGVGAHCFTVFKDTNALCAADARYKAISRGKPLRAKGLYVFKSPDAIHWALMREEPVITEGAFDSQNLAFWDTHLGQYRVYFRVFQDGLRHIMTSTSFDFVNWAEPQLLLFGDAPLEHLYTNAVLPYEPAPHLLIAFPTRYLPEQGQRVEPTFMSSRDRLNFHRWPEAVIPESAPADRSGNRSNYMAWGLLQLPSHQKEFSVYATEAYYVGPDSRVRRFTYRIDGFVSVHCKSQPGGLVTKPIRFTGSRLKLNSAALQGGSVRVELQDEFGQPVTGFEIDACTPITGDEVDHLVSWGGEPDLSSLQGLTVRLRFELERADLYSFQFTSPK